MELELIRPAASLNKAFRKTSLKRDQIELFKENLKRLFYRISDLEGEKHLIEMVPGSIKCTYFNLTSFESIIRNEDRSDDVKLIDLYETLSPEHLQKNTFC